MTDDLRSRLLASLDDEARRFAADHPGEETRIYASAIGARRRARSLAVAAGGLAIAIVLALGVLAILPGTALAPAPPALAPTVQPQTREWYPPGEHDPRGSASTLEDNWGAVIARAPACVELDAASRLDGAADSGGAPVALGAVAATSTGTNGLVARRFASDDEARAYVDWAEATAGECGAEVAAHGIEVTVADVGIARVPGTGAGIRVDVSAGGTWGTWSAWIYVVGPEALAVVVDPGAYSLAASSIVAWFAAGG